MELVLIGRTGTPMRAFPLGRRGVLLPLNDREAAAAGIAMYTASKRWVIFTQRLAFRFVSLFGARYLPGRRVAWSPPGTQAQWAELVRQWEASLGTITAFAAYQRPQTSRTGLTFVVMLEDHRSVVIKLRDRARSLDSEFAALTEVLRSSPTQFKVPVPLSSGSHQDWFWTAQECVFDQPHDPVFVVDDALFDEVSRALRPLFPQSPAATSSDSGGLWAPSHSDLTPWNLRCDRKGQVWLFDWEDVDLTPVGSDRTYFLVTSAALTGAALPGDLPAESVDFWRNVVVKRRIKEPEDAALSQAILTLLDGSVSGRTRRA